jgi:hypothetical protein
MPIDGLVETGLRLDVADSGQGPLMILKRQRVKDTSALSTTRRSSLDVQECLLGPNGTG